MATATVKQVEKSICLESYILIWLSEKSDSLLPDCKKLNELRAIINYQKIFDKIEECQQFINGIRNERLVIVSNEKLAKQFVSTIDQWENISAIYIYYKDDVPTAELSELQQNVSKTH